MIESIVHFHHMTVQYPPNAKIQAKPQNVPGLPVFSIPPIPKNLLSQITLDQAAIPNNPATTTAPNPACAT